MRRITVISMILVLMTSVLLSACNAREAAAAEQKNVSPIVNEKYTIFREEDKCYLQFQPECYARIKQLLQYEYYLFHENETSYNSDVLGSRISSIYESPKFQSVAQMKLCIENGDIPDECLAKLAKLCDSTGKREIMDVYNIYDLVLPKNLKIMQVTWGGMDYFCWIQQENWEDLETYLSGNVHVMYNADDYEFFRQMYYANFTEQWDPDLYKVISDEKNANGSKRTLITKTAVCEKKYICIEQNTRFGKLYIKEDYTLEYFEDIGRQASSTVPQKVVLFGENDTKGIYFEVNLYDATEELSKRWLRTFSLKPLEET